MKKADIEERREKCMALMMCNCSHPGECKIFDDEYEAQMEQVTDSKYDIYWWIAVAADFAALLAFLVLCYIVYVVGSVFIEPI